VQETQKDESIKNNGMHEEQIELEMETRSISSADMDHIREEDEEDEEIEDDEEYVIPFDEEKAEEEMEETYVISK
jgi:hypothetical protein